MWSLCGWTAVAQAQNAEGGANQDADQQSQLAESPLPTPMPSVIQKLPDYSGDLASRSFMTGDWGGKRTELAEQGILFDFSLTQILQGNAHGGKDTNNAFRYSGSVDYTLRLDTARMNLWPGGLITLRGETAFGQSINSKVGSILPSNYDALFPVPNDPGATTLSEFYITQALSEKVVLVAGKMDLTVGDSNVFAHNERTQFLNTALRINPVLFNAAPYTAMAAGVVLLPTDWLTITTFVNDNDPKGAVTQTGFNTAFHGRNWLSVAQEFDFKVKLFGQPGNQRFGWFWTSRDFMELGGDSRLNLPVRFAGRVGLPRAILPRWLRVLRLGNRAVQLADMDVEGEDWGLYYNFDQYLYTEADDPTQGIGIFGRVGWSTGEANLFEQFYSVGVGGKGTLPSRDHDTWGVGYYLANFSDSIRNVLNVHSEQGVELYYNIQVTPWLSITPDFQIIINPGGGFQDRDVALVYGLRTQMSF